MQEFLPLFDIHHNVYTSPQWYKAKASSASSSIQLQASFSNQATGLKVTLSEIDTLRANGK
jgi:hypothetical protein